MKMSIQEVTTKMRDDFGLPQTKIAKLLGVTPLMVHHYQKGKITSPNPKVAFNVWEKVKFDGERVVLDIFNNEDELISAYALHKEAEATKDDTV